MNVWASGQRAAALSLSPPFKAADTLRSLYARAGPDAAMTARRLCGCASIYMNFRACARALMMQRDREGIRRGQQRRGGDGNLLLLVAGVSRERVGCTN